MSKFEVTQGQWQTVMTNPHSKSGAVHATEEGAEANSTPSHFKGESLPVDSVSWDDIQVFLKRINARDPKHTYRLPTEAEWEYACKAGKTAEDPKHIGAVAWYRDNSDERTQPVGQKEPNAWGLYDMYGMCLSGCKIGTLLTIPLQVRRRILAVLRRARIEYFAGHAGSMPTNTAAQPSAGSTFPSVAFITSGSGL
jgi:hypothetical protein